MGMYKPIEQLTELEMRRALLSPIYSAEAKARIADRLKEVERVNDALRAGESAHVRVARAKHQARQVERRSWRGMDSRSLKNSTLNGAGIGSIAVGGVTVGEVIGVYDELKSRGLAPTEEQIKEKVFSLSDAELITLLTAFCIVFMLTMLWKFLKHYEGS